MRHKLSLLAVLAALVALFTFASARAQTTTTQLTMRGLPYTVINTAATSASVVGDGGGAGRAKQAYVVHWVVNGQDVYVLVRLQTAANGLFLDLVAEDSIADLTTRTAALSLGHSHPSPTKDAIDQAAIDDAGS